LGIIYSWRCIRSMRTPTMSPRVKVHQKKLWCGWLSGAESPGSQLQFRIITLYVPSYPSSPKMLKIFIKNHKVKECFEGEFHFPG